MNWWKSSKAKADQLKSEALALYLAFQDPRTPWYAKAWLALVLGYLASPIDLVPDFIPILGYIDDLLLVPAGLALALKMVPGDVLNECRAKAADPDRREGRMKLSVFPLVLASVVIAAIVAFVAVALMPRAFPRQKVPTAEMPSPVVVPDSALLPNGDFQFDLVCAGPLASGLGAILAADDIRVIDTCFGMGDGTILLRAASSRERFVRLFAAKLVSRTVARSSGDGYCELECLEGFTLPEKYRPFVSELRLLDPQFE